LKLLARTLPGLLPVRDRRAPLRVLIASLAPGGAERIVLEWLGAEVARRRDVELAVLHPRIHHLRPPRGIRLRQRGEETPEAFVRGLGRAWSSHPAPVSCHLVADPLLAVLWDAGLATVPVVHNSRAGWRNQPHAWAAGHVPQALACSPAVAAEMALGGCEVPIAAISHRPWVGRAAWDPAGRAAMRGTLGIAEGTFALLAVGAIKPQKHYERAVEVLARLHGERDAVLVIAGGVLDRAGLAELDRVVDRAVALGVDGALRLPGFVDPVEPWLAACDAMLNVSRFEGLSIATQEALFAGLPVVATAVGGQAALSHPGLRMVPADASAAAIAACLAPLPVRRALVPAPLRRAPREWSVPLHPRRRAGPRLETLFVTANLNAGGAQRSLVNLACQLAPSHRLAVAVCGDCTQAAFTDSLRAAGIEPFRPVPDADAFAVAESLLAHVAAGAARALCFWNVDPRVKRLVAKHAPPGLFLVDASPGAYAFEELRAACEDDDTLGFDADDYYARLDVLVLKHAAIGAPAARRVEVVENGVAATGLAWRPSAVPRYLVHGRIAPSKRLADVIDAFRQVVAREPHATLELVGSAEPRHEAELVRLRALAAGLPVTWRGADSGLGYLHETWTAAVVLGTHQGSPNAILEALAAGVPVIANASGGTAAMLDGGRAGWLLAEDCGVDEVAAAMLAAWHAPAEAAARARAGVARVEGLHGLARMAAGYRRILEEPVPAREKMAAWNIATVPAAPVPSRLAPSPATTAP
jgi:glycosyltransferase involved in cell wall biosynthesis